VPPSDSTAQGPFAEYTRRAAARQAEADRLAGRFHRRLRARTFALVLVVAVAWLCEKERLYHLLLAGPIVAFVVFVVAKDRARRRWVRAMRAVAFYERRLANLGESWIGTGEPGSRFLDDAHPCALDLDLFGAGSLFERLHLAGTPLGEDTLAAWLRTPTTAGEVRARQAAVAELRDHLDLREELALLGQQVPDQSGIDALTAWAAGHPLPSTTTAAYLGPLVAILARLRRERFASPLLGRLQATLAGARPLARLARLLAARQAAPPAFALALRAWRARHGQVLSGWLGALGELEALQALAAYAYENPADPFAEVLDDGPCFDADRLGHPLLSAHRCVRNDLRLDADRPLLIVSGSNMSGKSTLLRTVGVNAVLALAGAPVRAARLRLARLTPGATLRLQDSLVEGRSRFFAEVLRVRQLLELARTDAPLLFLLDELFSGTNSEDRRQGAAAVVRRLLDAGAVGLLTTHDLALTQLADELAPRAANVHFADQVEDGALAFDYRMRQGVLRSGNGVALMRMVGIEV
jgi:DNA mismatch repair ATPase MutS